MTTHDLPSRPASTQIRRNSRLISFGLVALCLLFVVGYVQRSAVKSAVEAEVSALQEEIAQARLQQAVLQDQLKNIDQPGAIDAAARDDLGLIQRGDQPIVGLHPPATATPPAFCWVAMVFLAPVAEPRATTPWFCVAQTSPSPWVAP